MRVAAVALVSALAFAGCSMSGNEGLLSTTCGEFVDADEATQMNVAAQWANPAQDGEITDQSKFMALGVRASLMRYCGAEGHEDDEIGDLESTGY